MRICSQFHDYYDSASAHGVDKTIVFNRVPKVIEGVSNEFSKTSGRVSVSSWITIENFWIGFCGRWYFGRMVETSPKYRFGYQSEPEKLEFFYGVEAINLAYPPKNGRVFESIWANNKRDDILALNGAENLDLFLEHDAPIIFIKGDKMVINPELKRWGFHKVFDAFSAFQAIEMFATNELAKQVDPAPLSDKSRIVAHGFDLKESFRNNQPAKRKRK